MSYLLLQAGGDSTFTWMIFGAIGIVWYLFFIRPQITRQRKQGDFQKELAKGDTVVTSSGIIGKINKLDEQTVTLEVGKVFIPFLREALSKEMTDAYLTKEDKE